MRRTPAASDWRGRYAGLLFSPDEAVAPVRSGDRVWAGGWTSVPTTLCGALAERRTELHDVGIYTFLTPFPWDRPELLESFRITSAYAGPNEREAVLAGRFDYLPIAQFREGGPPPGIDFDFDVALIPISPPDENGNCSFGGAVWFGPSVSRRAKLLVGEIHPEFIRTGGENSIHVSRFARLAEVQG
ncbi:MAG: hypothetical protein ACREQY_15310, partial [Candidatus Binatia bacterium]